MTNRIASIENACNLGDKTFDYLLTKIKEGVSEKELAMEIKFFIKKQEANISFPPIVAFGKNSYDPHHKPTHNSRLTTHNSIVLLDFGVKLNNYCSDMTRTVFFGKPTSEQKRMYQTVFDAQNKAIRSLIDKDAPCARSILAKHIDKVARDYITSKGYPTIPHSLGHGIGLKVHEPPKISPKSKDILKTGMVFTIEPGIYIEGFGGVRIEDVLLLESFGPRFLTNSTKEIINI